MVHVAADSGPRNENKHFHGNVVYGAIIIPAFMHNAAPSLCWRHYYNYNSTSLPVLKGSFTLLTVDGLL